MLGERDADAFAEVSRHLQRHREIRRVKTSNAYAVLFERRPESR